ncbi:MAG TPA: hypothetical protein VD913_06110, partial [bacterium]|nr:hypothetical protein [bacterium]
TFREESDILARHLNSSADSSDMKYTVGLILPENKDEYDGQFSAGNFVKTLNARIGTVAIAGKINPDLSNALKKHGKIIRPLSNLKRSLSDIDQSAVPAAVVGRSELRKIGQGFLPVWLDLKGVDDPFVRDYSGQLQAVIVSHLAEILHEKPEFINQRSELRAELLRRLAVFEGFGSLITTGERFGQTGVVISGVIAQAFLRHRAEIRLRSAA